MGYHKGPEEKGMTAVIIWSLLATCAGPHGHARGHVADRYLDRRSARHRAHAQNKGRHPEGNGAADRHGHCRWQCFLDMLGVFTEFETNLRRERQLEGIAKAKAAGVYRGRKPPIDQAQVERRRAEGLGATQIAKRLNLTVRRSIGCWPLKRENSHGRGVHCSHARRSDTHGR
jgi:hypothetical protein